MTNMFKKAGKEEQNGILGQALAEWRSRENRSDSGERLSGPARERVLDAIQGGGETRISFQRPLFPPLRRALLAAAAPALVLALAIGYMLSPTGTPIVESTAQATNLDVIRQGEEVVFVIANGGTVHHVYKSTEISGLGRAVPVEVSNGVYRDRIDRRAELVFYRID